MQSLPRSGTRLGVERRIEMTDIEFKKYMLKLFANNPLSTQQIECLIKAKEITLKAIEHYGEERMVNSIANGESLCDAPHLIETTLSGYEQRTYTIGIGVMRSDLTDDEKQIVAESEKYYKEYEAKENKQILALERSDFEKLRDIQNMPDEAIEILKQWTERNGDDEYED